MFFLKLFSPLKWALIQIIVEMAKGGGSHMSETNRQISETKLQLFMLYGFNPISGLSKTVAQLKEDIKDLSSQKEQLLRELDKLQQDIQTINERGITGRKNKKAS